MDAVPKAGGFPPITGHGVSDKSERSYPVYLCWF